MGIIPKRRLPLEGDPVHTGHGFSGTSCAGDAIQLDGGGE